MSVVSCSLAAALTSNATSVAVDNTNQLPPVPFVITFNGEDMLVTAVSNTATTLSTVTRGVGGTSAIAHLVNEVGTVKEFGGGTATYTGNMTVAGTLTAGPGIFKNGSSPMTTTSLNAHVSATTVVGNDTAGIVTYTTDGSGVAQNQTLFVMNFANTSLYATTTAINLTNITSGAASTTLHAGTYGALTAGPTGFSVVVLGAALTASGTFKFTYQVIGLG